MGFKPSNKFEANLNYRRLCLKKKQWIQIPLSNLLLSVPMNPQRSEQVGKYCMGEMKASRKPSYWKRKKVLRAKPRHSSPCQCNKTLLLQLKLPCAWDPSGSGRKLGRQAQMQEPGTFVQTEFRPHGDGSWMHSSISAIKFKLYKEIQKNRGQCISQAFWEILYSPLHATSGSVKFTCPLLGAKPGWQVQKQLPGVLVHDELEGHMASHSSISAQWRMSMGEQ